MKNHRERQQSKDQQRKPDHAAYLARLNFMGRILEKNNGELERQLRLLAGIRMGKYDYR
jgi:hypothetical protein